MKDREREQSVSIWQQIYGTIGLWGHPLIDPGCYGLLQIQLRCDLINPFFTPWSASDIQDTYPIDMDNPRTAKHIRICENYIDHGPTYPELGVGLRGRLRFVTTT